MSEIKFEIKEELGTLSESAKGWTKEVNLISVSCTHLTLPTIVGV